MPIYQFGVIVKQRREELGYTQEELADGICSVPTLSRIENGERMPAKEHMEMLLQRLGYSDTMLDTYVDTKVFILHELKFQIRQAVIMNQPERAKDLLNRFEQQADCHGQMAKQFLLLYRTLVSNLKPEKTLEQLEQAIRLTCPRYQTGKLPRILSYEEIIALNNIAVCNYDLGQLRQEQVYLQRAIDILYDLKRYYENHMTNTEEILRTQPMVLYNLSKYLGCAGRYDECVEVCDLGIRIARETGRCTQLHRMFYNRAWALSRRGYPADLEQARQSARLAYYMAAAMAQPASQAHYRHFIQSVLQDTDLL